MPIYFGYGARRHIHTKGKYMKTLFVSFLLASTAVIATAAENPSLSGKWQVHNSISGNESDQVCTFTQKDNAFTGSCTSDRGTVEISGKINAKKVTWAYKSEYNGAPLTVMYEGAMDSATKITGSVSVPEYQVQGDFTATQSAQ